MSEESVVYRRVTPEYDLVITCPSELLEESVVYQDIFQKGIERGARKWVMRQLELRFGKPSRTIQRQIERLAVEQLEALCVALLYFQTKDDFQTARADALSGARQKALRPQ